MEEERGRLLAKLTLAQVTIMALTSMLTKQRGEFPGRPRALLIIWNQCRGASIDFRRQCIRSFRHSSTPAFLLHSGLAAADPSRHRAAHCSSQGHVERQISMGYGLQTPEEKTETWLPLCLRASHLSHKSDVAWPIG